MPETQQTQIVESETATATGYEMDSIGIEFEYPLAQDAAEVPLSEPVTSGALRNSFGNWPAQDGGAMTADHVGAEIITPVLDLHSEAPERWYQQSIEIAEDAGYPFAMRSNGQTNFGLHLHLSEMPEHIVDAIREMSKTPWMRVFLCSDVRETSADPFRFGFYTPRPMTENPGCILGQDGRGDRHYEWRMPEPVAAEHFPLIMRFVQLLEAAGVDAARDFAQERVLHRDERLTAIKQYQALKERHDNWPNEEAVASGSVTNEEAARFFVRLMEDSRVA